MPVDRNPNPPFTGHKLYSKGRGFFPHQPSLARKLEKWKQEHRGELAAESGQVAEAQGSTLNPFIQYRGPPARNPAMQQEEVNQGEAVGGENEGTAVEEKKALVRSDPGLMEMHHSRSICKDKGIFSEGAALLGVKFAVFLSWVDEYDTFYFRGSPSTSNVSINRKLDAAIGLYDASRLEVLPHPEPLGLYCLVYFAGNFMHDEGFRRGRVVGVRSDIEPTKYIVRLVDLGVLIETTALGLYTLPDTYRRVRREAFKLKLTDFLPAKENLNPEALMKDIFQNLSLELCFMVHIQFKKHSGGLELTYDLEQDGKYWGRVLGSLHNRSFDLTQWLLEQGYIRKRESTEGPRFDDRKQFLSLCYTVAPENKDSLPDNVEVKILRGANSYHDFHLMQYEDEGILRKLHAMARRLDTLSNMVSWYYVSVDSEESALGSYCCVRDPSTGSIHRGKIRFIDETGVAAVKLIDQGRIVHFGLREPYLLQMPKTMLEYPRLSIPCALPVRVKSPDHDGQNSLRWFAERGQGFRVHVLAKEGKTHIVDLFWQKEDVTLCESLINWGYARSSPKMELAIRGNFAENKPNFVLSYDLYGRSKLTFNSRMDGVNWKDDSGYGDPYLMYATSINNKPAVPGPEVGPFHWSRIPKLADPFALKGKRCSFSRFKNFNKLHLIDEDALHNNYMATLRNLVDTRLKTGRGRFGPSHIPPMDDVVVCSGLGITENYRGIVIGLEKGLYSKVIVVVRNIESGFVSRVTLDDICTPNEAIMSLPAFVHFVTAAGVHDDVPILLTHFRKLRNSIRSVVYVANVTWDNHAFPRQLPVVHLMDPASGQDFSIMVNRLSAWKWRQLYRLGYEILPSLRDSVEPYEKWCVNNSLAAMLKKKRLSFVTKSWHCSGGCNLVVYGLPCEEIVLNQHRTVQMQMELFFSRRKSPILHPNDYTKLDRPVMLAVTSPEDAYRRMKPDFVNSLCIRHRCFYLSDQKYLYCVDCHWTGHNLNKVEAQLLHPDFYELPALGMVLTVDLTDYAPQSADMITKCASMLFPRGKIQQIICKAKYPGMYKGIPMYVAQHFEQTQ